ncbi:MAG: META domain-containing protein [Candidatus Nanopelagicales bacterium]
MRLGRGVLILGAVLVLAACSSGSTTPGPSPSPPAPVPQALAPGSTWVVVGPAALGEDVTITFADGQVTGKAAVNTYSAPFTATEDGSIDIGPITSTEIGGTPAQMAAEEQYFDALERAEAYDSDEVQLTLRTGSEALVRFAQPDSPAVFGRSLVGMKVARARKTAQAQGYDFRVVSVDGQSKPVTMDYRPDRLNATVVDGRVTEVTVG